VRAKTPSLRIGSNHANAVTDTMFGILLGGIAIVAAAVEALSGFGIGSMLVPIAALQTGTKLAIAAMAFPHLVGSAQRMWSLRHNVDRKVLLGFGVTSAVASFAGAVLHTWASSRWLAIIFGVLLIIAAVSEFTGLAERVKWGKRAAWVAGAVSGLLGGMVGNQGGIRSAAMLGFHVPKKSFIATATAIGLIVDCARMPVYLYTQGSDLLEIWPLVAWSTAGAIIGTALGTVLLKRIPQKVFIKSVAVLLLALGIYMIVAGGGD
jgi:uncharacterized membrane protein YfcA